MKNKHRKILNIISSIRESHSKMEDIFSYGSCLNLFIILRNIFPEAKPYFNIDHIITKIDNKFYDIKGTVLNTKEYKPYEKFFNKKGLNRSFTQMYNYELNICNYESR